MSKQQHGLVAIKKSLEQPAFLQRFEEVNQFKMTVAREVGFALQALGDNSYLATASPQSIQKAILNVSLTGLTLNPVLKQAYLVPRRVKGVVTAVLDPSYQGMITKMIEWGVGSQVVAQVVHANDEFDFDEATDSMLKPHKKWYLLGKTESGAELGAYAGILTPNGWQYKFMPTFRINEIRDRSESYKAFVRDNNRSTIWNTDREEMVKKTVVRYLWKYVPKSEKIEALGEVFENFDEANAITNNDYTESGQEIVTKAENKAVNSLKTALKGKVVVSRKDKETESIDYEDVEQQAKEELADESLQANLIELQQILEDNYSVADGQVRDDTEQGEVADAILMFLNIDKESLSKTVSEKTKTYKDADEFLRLGTVEQIMTIVKIIVAQ